MGWWEKHLPKFMEDVEQNMVHRGPVPREDVKHLALLHLGIKVAKESTVEHSVEQSFTYSFFTLLWKGQSKVNPNNVHSSLVAASPSLPSPAAVAGPGPTQTSLCCSRRTPTPPHGVWNIETRSMTKGLWHTCLDRTKEHSLNVKRGIPSTGCVGSSSLCKECFRAKACSYAAKWERKTVCERCHSQQTYQDCGKLSGEEKKKGNWSSPWKLNKNHSCEEEEDLGERYVRNYKGLNTSLKEELSVWFKVAEYEVEKCVRARRN